MAYKKGDKVAVVIPTVYYGKIIGRIDDKYQIKFDDGSYTTREEPEIQRSQE